MENQHIISFILIIAFYIPVFIYLYFFFNPDKGVRMAQHRIRKQLERIGFKVTIEATKDATRIVKTNSAVAALVLVIIALAVTLRMIAF